MQFGAREPVRGVSPVTRALGLHGEPDLKRAIAPEPQVAHCVLDQHSVCLILDSDGLFRVFRPSDIRILLLDVS